MHLSLEFRGVSKIKNLVIKMLNFVESRKRYNKTIDSFVRAAEIGENEDFFSSNNFESEKVVRWLMNGGLEEFIKTKYFHKKGLEFFFSAELLDLNEKDVVLDAAGGRSRYLHALKGNGHNGDLYLTDHLYSGLSKKDGIQVVGGDISKLDLHDCSIDKISCHHAFEHFQEDKDMLFIKEIERLLAPGGRAVITPLFVGEKYIECWNVNHEKKFDEDAILLIDKSASIPGADDDGHFARIYDIQSLKSRIFKTAESCGLAYSVVEMRIDGNRMPDMTKNFGSNLNFPLRALVLDKLNYG